MNLRNKRISNIGQLTYAKGFMKSLTLLLALLLSPLANAGDYIGYLTDSVGRPVHGTVIVTPIPTPFANGTNTVTDVVYQTNVTSGLIRGTLVGGRYYVESPGVVKRFQILMPPDDTNTWQLNTLAALATNLGTFVYTNRVGVSTYLFAGLNISLATNNPGLATESLTISASGTISANVATNPVFFVDGGGELSIKRDDTGAKLLVVDYDTGAVRGFNSLWSLSAAGYFSFGAGAIYSDATGITAPAFFGSGASLTGVEHTLTFSSPLSRSGNTISLPVGTSSANGYISSVDWSTFNSKESALTFSSPLSRSVNTISLAAASGSVNGYLASGDWTTFNSKENALTFSSPLSRSVNTISVPVATTSVSGYLSSTDWNTFNGKQAALGFTAVPSTRLFTFTGALNQISVSGNGDFSIDRTISIALVSSPTVSGTMTAGTFSGSLADSFVTFTDITTGNASTSSHGFVKKLSGSGFDYFDGNGNYSRTTNFVTIALSDETTALTTGTKFVMRAPHAMTLKDVRASVTTVSSSGIPTINIKESGTTIFSTKLTIDASEKTSTTAATAYVFSDTSIADDAELTFDVDVAGTGTAGLKVTIFYTR